MLIRNKLSGIEQSCALLRCMKDYWWHGRRCRAWFVAVTGRPRPRIVLTIKPLREVRSTSHGRGETGGRKKAAQEENHAAAVQRGAETAAGTKTEYCTSGNPFR